MSIHKSFLFFIFLLALNTLHADVQPVNFKQSWKNEPLACTIDQAEIDALWDLYNSTDGPNWTSQNDGNPNNDWSMTNPIENWFGLMLDCNNHTIKSINLQDNNLSGNLPNTIGQLPNLLALKLSLNNLSGQIPSTIGQLTKLTSLGLSKNQFTGQIPNSLTQLSNVEWLYLDDNMLSGQIPDFSANTFLWLSFNNNAFQFGDFESEFVAYANNNVFWYAPQSNVDTAETRNVLAGNNTSLQVNCSGTQNIYQWYKNNIILTDDSRISGAQTSILNINNLNLSDTGEYHCRVTNTICTHGGSPSSGFQNLEIRREPITLSVTTPLIDIPNTYNYADSVIAFSSEWSSSSWNHNEVLGHFNTYPCYGDISTSWASASSGAEREFLELYFNNAAPIDSILIYETYNAGAIDTVYVKNPNTNAWEVVYTATPTNITSSRILKIGFPTTAFNVSEVRIAIYSQGTSWNEIDAVAINSIPDEIPDSATLDCNNSTISIGSSCGGTDIGDATFLWTTNSGNIISGANTASANIDAAGLYTLSVTKNNDIVSYDVLVNSNINSIPPTDYSQTFCAGQSITINGTTYDQNNPTGNETLTGASGCDSIININLTFIDTTTTDYYQTLCTGEMLTINGTIYDQNNPTGTETLTSVSGCDSIVNIHLTFNNTIHTDYNQTLCNGQDLMVNGTIYNQNNPSGTETLTTASGCDSIVNINLSFLPPISTNITQTLCYEKSITINGTIYNQSNPSGTEILTAASGCDSTININLNFLAPIYSIFNQTLCPGEEYILNGTTYNQSNPAGAETLTTLAGCDSIVNINLTFLEPIITDINPTLCLGEDLTVNDIIYNQNNPSGTEILTAASGCDSTVNIQLNFITTPPNLMNDNFVVTSKADTTLIILSNDSLPDDWTIDIISTNFPDYFNVNYQGNLDVFPNLANRRDFLTISYVICNYTCSDLCDTAQVNIKFKFADPNKDVLVSDILTLNGDGKNDLLFFKNVSYNNMGIQIFNRWGDLVFAENPYRNQWNGTNQSGDNLPNGTYYYILTINRADRKIITGDVLLVR